MDTTMLADILAYYNLRSVLANKITHAGLFSLFSHQFLYVGCHTVLRN
jgi:hypothetical protein